MSRFWWIVAGLVALVGVIQVNKLLLLMSLLLALIGGASHLWSRYCLTHVSYRRRIIPKRIFYGEEAHLLLETVNAKPLPLAWMRTSDGFPADVELLTGTLNRTLNPHRRLLVNTLSLRWYEQVTRRYRLRGVKRGAWVFGPAQIVSGDIFGLSVKRDVVEETDVLVVYPKTVPIHALGLPTLHPFGDFRTPHRLIQDPIRLTGAREYVPGDSFRHIHWKATAHRHVLQTKTFDPSASRPLAVFLNIRTSQQVAVDRDLLELAITTAASIAHWGWEQDYPVGLYVNSILQPSRERIRIPPVTRPDRLNWILEALARVEVLGPWSMATILQVEATALPYGTAIVLISAILDDRLKRTLVDLRKREHGVTLITLGDARVDKPLPGVQTYHIGGGERWHELESLELAG
jgi:uncharacterized protein (DUF58 family)